VFQGLIKTSISFEPPGVPAWFLPPAARGMVADKAISADNTTTVLFMIYLQKKII
jgi:hypothetical protein